ncbi:MAG: hypothetical protein JWO48_1177, partial [Bryobacterales bacterium]|nr:hypothetical protein [Bryobacterales bacterium]
MNEYVEYQDHLRCSRLMLAARRARRSNPSLRYYLVIAVLAAANTLTAANLAELHGRVKRSLPERRPVAAADASAGSTTFNTDQGPGLGPIGPGPGCNLLPAPASVGAAVNLSYFGPPPSESNPSLVGPVQLLKSGTIDAAKGTITLPLYQGSLAGSKKTVWYILTDVDDQGVATLLGLNYSAKLSYAANGARTANLDENGNLVFDKGTVDFSPVRSIVPGPPGAEFPPQSAQPGAVGDKDYSPLVRVLNAGGVIYNAPMIAFGVGANDINFPSGGVDYSKVHDQVVAIDPINMTVTLNVINGFSFGRPVWYLSTETSIPLGAAIEHNT